MIEIYKDMHSENEQQTNVYIVGDLVMDDTVPSLLHRIHAYGGGSSSAYISSIGGAIDVFTSIRQMLMVSGSLFKKTEVLSTAHSTAAMIFTLSDVRIVNERASFTLHPVLYTTIKGDKITTSIDELRNTNISMYKEFLNNDWITKKEYKMLTLKKDTKTYDIDFGYREALRRGIATHVRVGKKLISAKDYLKNKKG